MKPYIILFFFRACRIYSSKLDTKWQQVVLWSSEPDNMTAGSPLANLNSTIYVISEISDIFFFYFQYRSYFGFSFVNYELCETIILNVFVFEEKSPAHC